MDSKLPFHNSPRRNSYSQKLVMRLFQVLLATIFALLTCNEVISATSENGRTKISTLTLSERAVSNSIFADQRRSLRTSRAADIDDESTEEKSLLKNLKVRWWLETDKTDEYVLKALKLDGLDDAALKTQKNYKYYKSFARKSLAYRINKWLMKDTTMFNVWKELGFRRITKSQQLDQIMGTANFKVYEGYVNNFDFNVERMMKACYNPPAVLISRGATEAEMMARTTIMAKVGREDEYAKVLLGMTVPGKPRATLKGDALKEHVDYQYFKHFQRQKEKFAATKTTS